MSVTPELLLLDVNETLSDLSPLRSRCTGLGAPPQHLFETWFAGTLRDGFTLAAAQRSGPSPSPPWLSPGYAARSAAAGVV